MKGIIKLIALLAIAATTRAQNNFFEVPLYGKQIPLSTGEVWRVDPEVDTLLSGNFSPTLTVFQPTIKKPNAPAVISCPGGGYHTLLISREGWLVARAFNKRGIVAIVLKYRLRSGELALQDVQQAIKTTREHAMDWGFSPAKIGIMGFSAGGHLAAFAGTHFDTALVENKNGTSLRPNFMILVNPVISFMDDLTHVGTRKNLLGKDLSPEKKFFLSNEYHVSNNTPPCWMVHASNDSVVTVANSLTFYNALIRKKLSAALHIYARGGHGFLKDTPPFEEWFERCLYWMKNEKYDKDCL